MKERLTDDCGRTIGWIEHQGDKLWLTDQNGKQLGYYSKSYDATFNVYGQRVGGGNILGTLL
jgi:hypothetical protein